MFLGLTFLCPTAQAQTIFGSFHGTITDPSGAVIPDATIQITNIGTNASRTVESNNVGYYTITQIPPGQYSFSVSKSGFTTSRRASVQLQVNEDLAVDFGLQPGAVKQVIEVTGAPPALKTATATLGSVVQSRQIVSLPLNGRQFTQLVLLTPGAAPKEGGQQGAFTIPIGGGGISPAVNGQRGQQNNFTLDGVLNNAIFTNVWSISPPPDAIQEFNVQSHIVDAQFSISSGANVNVATKSGTNELHGDVWEFLRNDKLDAANFFDNFANQKKPPFRQNQYGFTIGGPVVLPHYDGRKHKTYFFGYWEGFRSSEGFTQFNSVPTANELGGNFSGLLTNTQEGTDALGRPIYQGQIFDPYSTRNVTAGQVDPTTGLTAVSTGVVRDPFSGNIIPSGMLNQQALTYLKAWYPAPNFGPGFPNLATPSSQRITSDQFGVKLDQTFGNNDTLYGGFYWSQPDEIFPTSLLIGANTAKNHARVLTLGYTHLFSSTLLATFHYGYNKSDFGTTNQPGGLDLLQATNTLAFAPVRSGIPLVPQISLAPRLGGTGQFAIPLGPIRGHEVSGDFQKIAGSHTLSAGFMLYKIHAFDDGWGNSVNFDQFPTSATLGAGNVATTGDGLASMLLNVPSGLFAFVGNTAADEKTMWQGYYLQDKWQVSKKLSLQYGIRWDFVSPPSYKNNQVSGWNPECPIPAAGSLQTQTQINSLIQACFLIPVPFVQPPTTANPNPPSWPFPNVRKSYFDPKYNGWQPRLGFAYSVNPKTVVRGAFAIFDDHNNSLVQEAQDPRIAWPFGAGISVGPSNRGVPDLFFNALPAGASFLPPSNATPALAFAADPRLKIPYSMEFNMGIQRQLATDLTLSVNYSGSQSRHLFIQPMYNAPLPSLMGPGPVAPRTPFPFMGQFPNDFNVGVSNYNALQAELEKRFSQGLTFLASYTYSKCLSIQDEGQSGSIQNPYNWGADYGNCDFNIPQIFVFSYTYQLPFGHGRHFASGTSGVVDGIIGGWQWSGITSVQSGLPFTPTVGFDNANINPSSETQRADRVPSVSLTPSGGQTIQEWYNTAAFAVPAPYTFGTAGRNILRGPSYTNFDMSFVKQFNITETKSLQIRADMFNIFNHSNFAPPGGGASGGFSTIGGASSTAVSSPNFMRILSAAAPREIQVALKINF